MTEQNTVRVLVADDNRLVRIGIVALLRTEPGFEVVAEASDGAEAINLFRQHSPDVLLLDLHMPVLDGTQVIAQLQRGDKDARILVLTHYDGEEDVFRAMEAGARGYVTKDLPPEEIVKAVREVAKGGHFMPSQMIGRLAERMNQTALTRREQQVLQGLARGSTNRQIAVELEISEKTCGIHVGNILAKLDAHTRTEAVDIAYRRGLLHRDR